MAADLQLDIERLVATAVELGDEPAELLAHTADSALQLSRGISRRLLDPVTAQVDRGAV